ncbi:MAG: hypothetical protein AAF206_28100, partial [Bacteroidota bacterium]
DVSGVAEPEPADSPEILLAAKEKERHQLQLLSRLGEPCRTILEHWRLHYSMKEIAAKVGYKNEAVARKKKRLCMKKLLDILDQEPGWEQLIR